MEELDFSKIFGETATSKASFTNENYISGWGYLGSTPPPYQLFDYLQGLNDKKSKYLYDSLNENKNSLLAHNTDTSAHTDIRQKFNSYLSKVEGETKFSTHNADVNAHTPILNAIKAITGMSEYDVAPSKTISAIIPLLGYGGIVAQKLEDNGYIKFANGFTLQFGLTGDIPKNGTYQVDYPIAFTLLLYAGGFATINGDASNQDGIKMYNLPNQYNMTLLNTADNYTARTYWLAIGLI